MGDHRLDELNGAIVGAIVVVYDQTESLQEHRIDRDTRRVQRIPRESQPKNVYEAWRPIRYLTRL